FARPVAVFQLLGGVGRTTVKLEEHELSEALFQITVHVARGVSEGAVRPYVIGDGIVSRDSTLGPVVVGRHEPPLVEPQWFPPSLAVAHGVGDAVVLLRLRAAPT